APPPVHGRLVARQVRPGWPVCRRGTQASDVSGRTNRRAPHAGSPTPAPPARGGARERGIPHAGPAGSGRSAGTRNCISTDMSFDADVVVVGAGPAGGRVGMVLAGSSVRGRIVDGVWCEGG